VDAGEARHNHSFTRLFRFSKAVAFHSFQPQGAGLAANVLLADAARKLVHNPKYLSWLFCGKYNVEQATDSS
jgi:hypothetical protein